MMNGNLSSRLALRAFGAQEEKCLRLVLKPAPNSLPAGRLDILVGSGFGALHRAPHPHCARPANPRLMPRICSYGLAQRRRQATVRCNTDWAQEFIVVRPGLRPSGSHRKDNQMEYFIRPETKEDERTVEEITRKAFWNIHSPGCNEHYLAYKLRNSRDFINELDLVITHQNQVIGNIMYTRSYIINSDQQRVETTTFGPVSILPEYQKKGFGFVLIQESMKMAKEMGFPAIIIFGNPHDYCKHGFVGSKKYNIGMENEIFPCGLLIKVFNEKSIQNSKWILHESDSYNISEDQEFEEYEKRFEPMKKKWKPSQEEFDILSHSIVV